MRKSIQNPSTIPNLHQYQTILFAAPLLNRLDDAGNEGVLNDVEATDKSIAAGGKNSVKNEYGVSDPYATGSRKAINTKELMQKLQKIQSISLKVKDKNTKYYIYA